MKILKEKQVISESIIEIEEEGLISLIGENVTFFCAVYIYTGKLVGVNKTCVKLESPKIVYETGDFKNRDWKDAQPLPNEIYIMLGMIEIFGIVK